MNRQLARRALRKVAKKHGVPLAEVKRDIELAAEEIKHTPNAIIQARLSAIPFKDNQLTAVDLVAHCAKSAKAKMK